MKNLLILGALFLFTSCASRTDFGECVGVNDDRNPDLVYQVSARNVVIGVIFAEMIFPPILVILNQTFCPVGTKEKK